MSKDEIANNILLDRVCDNCFYSWDCGPDQSEEFTCEKWHSQDITINHAKLNGKVIKNVVGRFSIGEYNE